MLLAALIFLGVLLLLASILLVSDNLLNIEAQKEGIDTNINNVGVFPRMSELFGKRNAPMLKNATFHSLKKGFDIKLQGEATGPVQEIQVNRYAVKPTDFRGIAPIPKVEVEVGDEVKAGDVLFYDKKSPDIKYVSPVSGEVVEIRRGAKRSISHVIVLADKEQSYKQFNPPGQEASSEELIEFLIGTGVWPHINQRPFDIVPDPKVVPENIFISSFNTAPMAVNTNLMVEGNGTFFQKGLDTLCKLTSGKVYLGLDGRKTKTPHPVFANAENVEKHYFDGKHPSGNVGVQIHHTNPIKKNTSVWTLDVETVIALGKLMEKGIYDFRRMVALTGTQFKENHIYNSFEGSSIVELTEGKLIHDKSSTRLVSGNILSGKHISVDDFMSKGHNQLTSIKEGDYNELFGWLLPIKPRPSLSKTFPSFLMGNYKFDS
ncbi:MAG: NADH:ubiquinone reductase (Na(+)-transporting) subunit A, partial [Bacteroidia bacterium]|nr:NADH:ubiquinone reductase (Na(+)-transporting) subunit A [Bacteroidia bacterium]